MIVRHAIAADRSAVLNLIRTNPSLPQWSIEDLAADTAAPASTAVHRALLVAEDRDGICGFAQTVVVLGEAELEGMAVSGAKRGQGIGRALLDACLRWAVQVGATLFRLEVRIGNRAAIHLYESAGLQAAGMRHGYYRAPLEDALLMQRNL